MAIDPVIGAGISTAGSIFGSLVQNMGSRKRQNKAFRQTKQLWNLQNEYNHPSAQMARLRDAGLNPNLIYGTPSSASVGNADKITPPSMPEFTFENPLQNINQFQDTEVKKAQVNNLEASANVAIQEAVLKSAQTSDIGIKTARSKFDLGLAQELKNTSLEAAKENLRFMEQGTIGRTIDNFVKDKTKANVVKDISYRWKIAKETLEGKTLDNAYKVLEADLAKIGIRRNDPFYYKFFSQLFDKVGKIQRSFKSPIKN